MICQIERVEDCFLKDLSKIGTKVRIYTEKRIKLLGNEAFF